LRRRPRERTEPWREGTTAGARRARLSGAGGRYDSSPEPEDESSRSSSSWLLVVVRGEVGRRWDRGAAAEKRRPAVEDGG